MVNRKKIIGVMGAGMKDWEEFAKPLGAFIATLDVHLLTGGGDGTMSCVSQAFTDVETRKGLSLGIVKTSACEKHGFVPAKGYPNAFVEVPIYTPLDGFDAQDPTGINRNHINILSSDVIVALPGGKGTENEIEIAHAYNKKIILFTPEGFFDHLKLDIPHTDRLSVVESFLRKNIT